MPLGRWHKRILCKWLLYDGEETLKSWNPMLNTIFALRDHRNAPYKSKTSFAAQFFCAICQAALPGRPFDTRILYGKKAVGQNCRTAPFMRNFVQRKYDAMGTKTPSGSGIFPFLIYLFQSNTRTAAGSRCTDAYV